VSSHLLSIYTRMVKNNQTRKEIRKKKKKRERDALCVWRGRSEQTSVAAAWVLRLFVYHLNYGTYVCVCGRLSTDNCPKEK
jgi:hypothetical protein